MISLLPLPHVGVGAGSVGLLLSVSRSEGGIYASQHIARVLVGGVRVGWRGSAQALVRDAMGTSTPVSLYDLHIFSSQCIQTIHFFLQF